MADDRLLSDRFPRSNAYHPDWVIKNGTSGTGSTLWLTEWLSEAMNLKPGMRVLDLGCGRACSSIFLAREFQVQVWAADLWFGASENLKRIEEAGLQDQVLPIQADARSLPFAGEYFDAICSVDAYPYFGTDDLFLNYIAHFLKPGGRLGIVGAGLVNELDQGVPEHMQSEWGQSFWAIHSAEWWKRLWGRTGIVEIEAAENLPDAWQHWRAWQVGAHPGNVSEIEMINADRGRNLTWIRAVGRRHPDVKLADYCWPSTLRQFLFPPEFEPRPLLRS